MITKVLKFETGDGTIFDDEIDARNHHERIVETEEQLRKVLDVSYKTDRPQSVLRSMVANHAREVRDILNKYLARLPNPNKCRKVPVGGKLVAASSDSPGTISPGTIRGFDPY